METHVQTQSQDVARARVSWNKGKLIGQKAPLKLKAIYELLETVTDRCEDVANVMQGIVIENA